MEWIEILSGRLNKFDPPYPLGPKEFKALRDAVINLSERVKFLEDKLVSKILNEPVVHDGPLLTVPSESSMAEPKKRGRQKA